MKRALLVVAVLLLILSQSYAGEILSVGSDYWWSNLGAHLRTNSDVAGLGTEFTHEDLGWDSEQNAPVAWLDVSTPFFSLALEHYTLHYSGSVTLTSNVTIGDETFLVTTTLETRLRVASYQLQALFALTPGLSKFNLKVGASLRVVDYHLWAHGTAAVIPPEERSEEVRTQAPFLTPVASAVLRPRPFISFRASLAAFAYHSTEADFVLHRYVRFRAAVALHPAPTIMLMAGLLSYDLDFEDTDPDMGFHYIEATTGPFLTFCFFF